MLKNEDLKFNKIEVAFGEENHPIKSALWTRIPPGRGDNTREPRPIYTDTILYKHFSNLAKEKGFKVNDLLEEFMRDFIRKQKKV